MKPKIIVAGTGRDGTVSMTHFLSQLYHNENLGKEACHEFANRECYNRLDVYWKNKLKNNTGFEDELSKLKQTFLDCPYDAIVSNAYAFAFLEIPDAFPKDAIFIHLKRRDRQACIDSWTKCCELFPEANGNYTDRDDIDIQVWRTAAFHVGETTEAEWKTWSLQDKYAWYYDRTHSLTEAMAAHFPKRMNVYTEDLSNPDKLAEIADFIGMPLDKKPDPIRKNKFVYADVTQVESFFTPKAQWLYGHFDFPRSVAKEDYPIDYFCERYISWYSYLLADKDLGELARYSMSHVDMYKNVKMARKNIGKWYRAFINHEITMIRRIIKQKVQRIFSWG